MKKIVLAIAVLASGTLAACADFFGGHGDPQLLAAASISQADAHAIALAARPGEVKIWKVVRSSEDNRLVYSFLIRSWRKMYHVRVDAMNGAVIENDRKFGD